ncbi:MAG TPA: peptidase M20 [Anaerolinea thermolimosa]|uniref:Peptidase M20 n=1 Tax=Anaerolinea thermolimosa TaxID=229919 RepID=A0A3D1JHC5_9CHLR|nr:M20/M25/M40 family metallo-hydrolase [Anaerolinea thermolimosa]GAP05869.1 acetylornithine deacetylase [Anaerolinea thermolimosa]HCE17979.1 peptidase M20 [Anaerolinea thermolimosa]
MILIDSRQTQQVVETACLIQQIPAPTFHEEQRAAYVLEQFQQQNLTNPHLDAVGNVLACLKGQPGASPLIISAHLDSVFPPGYPLPLQRQEDQIIGPGIGDNALGLAALLHLPHLLRQTGIFPEGDLWLAATVGEEGLGNLSGMRHLVEQFTDRPLAYLSLEGMGLGNIIHRGLGVDRYRFTVKTAGGHSWSDYGAPSAIHELVNLANRLLKLRLTRRPRSTLNIGILQGGTSINAIAASATMEVDFRSESAVALEELVTQALRSAKSLERPGVSIETTRIGWRPAGSIPASHPLVQLGVTILRSLNLSPHLDIASTEANLPLSLGLPALTLGLTIGHHAHTLDETIQVSPLAKGLAALVHFVARVWKT